MVDGAQAVVLCEGLQDWVFVRRTLMTLGYDARRIRVLPYPHDGQGAGEQHVREQYAREVRSHRSRAARMKTALVVHTDADTKAVQERYESLERQLDGAGLAPRDAHETIAVLIPKRNTETWIRFLDGHTVDEVTPCPKFTGHESDTWRAAETFAVHVKNATSPAQAPPSLLRGIQESRRIL